MTVAGALGSPPRLEDEARVYVLWQQQLGASGSEAAAAVRRSGALPWLSVVLRSSPPLRDNLDALGRELLELTALVRGLGEEAHVAIGWQPEGSPGPDPITQDPTEYAFLLKRASVAIAGANATARVATAPLVPDEALLRRLYGEEIGAYIDAVVLRPSREETLGQAVALIAEIDPGRTLVLDALPTPREPLEVLSEAARHAALGIPVTFFELNETDREQSDQTLRALKLLAREFQGDLSLDPYSVPSGGGEAWSFVRGSDLELRVIARASPGTESLILHFPDPQLTSPDRVDLSTGEVIPLYGVRRKAEEVEVEIADPEAVVVLQMERTVAQLGGVEGVEERVTVEDVRQMPVAEILRRLQAFEDRQSRRLRHYRARNTTHLRFQFGTGVQNLEVTYAGDFFFRQGEGFDWAWQEFYINGVRWRSKKVPKIPLIQPEKAAALPLEIHFTKEYAYRLRGTALVDGRDCWVVEFQPNAVVAGRSLYRGTVWVDRELYARVRTRTVQLGLEGEVLSNEETVHYTPVDSSGAAAPWELESYWLPLRIAGQQLLSVLNSTTVVEREILLNEVLVNGQTFEERRQEVLASPVTMLRDTDEGLRYLVPDEETGGRVVQDELDPNRLFGAAGVFYDESFDFPIPLAGIDYFSFDFRGTGAQVNAFFAGPLLMANIATPNLFGSRFDAGVDIFAVAFAGSDKRFRDGREVAQEEVESLSPNLEISLGHPVGEYGKLDFEYGLRYTDYRRADDTAEEFVLPRNHLTHSFSLTARYNRGGYRSRLSGSFHRRSRWEEWGLPGNLDFDPAARDYTRWGGALAKIWHLEYFQKIGAEIEYVDGADLDRFAKYEFGFFSDTRVHGYESGRVRASRAWASHLSYGFEVGSLFRMDLIGDGAWATDEASGLDQEFLAGVGLVGTIIGPWRTIINVDLGRTLAGPDDGFVVFLAFLKLFGG